MTPTLRRLAGSAYSSGRDLWISGRGDVRAHNDDVEMPVQTDLFGCFTDNFGVLIHDPGSGATASKNAFEHRPCPAPCEARPSIP